MAFGMSPLLFAHVLVSLIAIATGIVMVYGLIAGRSHGSWTAAFLATTILTSLTGFPLPATQLLPSHIVGIISMILLLIAVAAIYLYHLRGAWRWIYVASAVAAFYLNVFVAVVQSFRKISFLIPLAPTESEPPFVATQTIVLVIFIILGMVAARRFHPPRHAA